MQLTSDEIGGPVDAIARFRYAVLGRASGLLDRDRNGQHADGEALRDVTGLLATSLEELKVAEEELRAQNTQLLEQRTASEAQLKHYRDLFMHSPAPAFVTDLLGTIQEVNLAAGRLLRRDPDLVAGKPIVALVSNSCREDFRKKLSRVLAADGVPRDWRFVMARSKDGPTDVCATVQRIDEAPGRSRLYWLLSAPQGSATGHVWDFDGSSTE